MTLFFAALACLPAHLPAQVSLATVVDLAEKNSTGVRAAQADVEKARAQVSESKDVIIPSLLFGTGLPVFPEVGFTGSPPSIWTATIQSLVFSVPQKRYIDAAQLGLKASASRLKDTREQVALDASTAYIELDAVNQELDAAHEQDQFAQRMVQIEQQRVDAGVDPLSELLQAKLQAAEIRLKRLHLETRATNLANQLNALTGLPTGSIKVDHTSIPEIPQVHGDTARVDLAAIHASQMIAQSKFLQAKGDVESSYLPEFRFFMQYNRNTNLLNDVSSFFAKPLPPNNFASGISVQIPIFDMGRRARAKESSADALRSKIEAEQAQKQNDLEVAAISGSGDCHSQTADRGRTVENRVGTVELRQWLWGRAGFAAATWPQGRAACANR
jgi:outer membrane protein TolC